MSSRFARRRSFFKSCDSFRVGLSQLWPGQAQPKPQLPENALTLPHAQRDLISLPQVLGKQLTIPQVSGMAEFPRAVPQLASKLRPLLSIE